MKIVNLFVVSANNKGIMLTNLTNHPSHNHKNQIIEYLCLNALYIE